ncbi:hypothetical protein ACFSQD_17790 [Flavihumibacter stibioxidans]|nr:hypothetical protein [Flavihumibacter stibioxidans]
MRSILMRISIFAAFVVIFGACQKQDNTNLTTTSVDPNKQFLTIPEEVINGIIPPHPSCTSPYLVELEIKGVGDGNYAWIWKVTNKNPGNGKNGTAQDLSHWGIQLEACVRSAERNATMDHIVGAAYSFDGENWTSFTPSYKPDPSIKNTCGFETPNILKFDVGTNGNKPTYYKLIVNKWFSVNRFAKAFYKSGKNTGCGEICIPSFCCLCEH